MCLPRSSTDWQQKLRQFLDITFGGTSRGGTAPCPCPRCVCMSYRPQSEVQLHVLSRGFAESFINEGEGSDVGLYNQDVHPADVEVHNDAPPPANVEADNKATAEEVGDDNNKESTPSEDHGATHLVRSLIRGAIHGEIIDIDDNEQPNKHAKIFLKLLQEAEKQLYPGCTDATKVSFIVELFQVKCSTGMSNRALEAVLNLFSRFLPKGHCVPDTMEKVQRVVRDLGLDYVKIDACEKDCVLFWKENTNLDTCPKCGESRWKTSDGGAYDQRGDADGGAGADKTNKKRVPRKILRYFPLTPRLQRLYTTESTSSQM